MTCHPAFFDKLPTFWAVKSNIQVSGELTTSRGPGTSFQFALSFVEQLFGDSIAREVGNFLVRPSLKFFHLLPVSHYAANGLTLTFLPIVFARSCIMVIIILRRKNSTALHGRLITVLP